MRSPTPTTRGPGSPAPGETGAEGRKRYRDYRRQQGLQLLSLLPDGAVRPLYRRARERSGVRGDVADPMALLLDFCQDILPLPPFDVWQADRAAHPGAHLDETTPAPRRGAGPSPPVTVDLRSFEADGTAWNAALDVRPSGDVWRGHITFHTVDGSPRTYPTGEIFNEDEARAVRERFLDFDDRTLQAFLRSALP